MIRSDANFLLEDMLKKALQEEPLSRTDVLYLLGLQQSEELGKLFVAARMLRQRYFGDSIFLYGFLYLSTWCRNDCTFCGYRVSNTSCRRYRKTAREVIEAAVDMAASGVHLLDLTTGEDPLYYEKEDGLPRLVELVQEVKRQTALPIMISFGALPDTIQDGLSDAGAEWYACYQETHNKTLFKKLRLNQDYDERLRKKYRAIERGLLVEEGILSGVGESLEDIADSMEEMRKMDAHQVRVMNFVPQRGTPMQGVRPPHGQRELMIIALLRLLFPDRLIPASLDVNGIGGLKAKLEAGANVVTSLIQPRSGMAGVAQTALDIGEGRRTVEGITPILDELGLHKAELDDYRSWIQTERARSS